MNVELGSGQEAETAEEQLLVVGQIPVGQAEDRGQAAGLVCVPGQFAPGFVRGETVGQPLQAPGLPAAAQQRSGDQQRQGQAPAAFGHCLPSERHPVRLVRLLARIRTHACSLRTDHKLEHLLGSDSQPSGRALSWTVLGCATSTSTGTTRLGLFQVVPDVRLERHPLASVVLGEPFYLLMRLAADVPSPVCEGFTVLVREAACCTTATTGHSVTLRTVTSHHLHVTFGCRRARTSRADRPPPRGTPCHPPHRNSSLPIPRTPAPVSRAGRSCSAAQPSWPWARSRAKAPGPRPKRPPPRLAGQPASTRQARSARVLVRRQPRRFRRWSGLARRSCRRLHRRYPSPSALPASRSLRRRHGSMGSTSRWAGGMAR